MDALFSKMLKAGSTTYFMDVKEAKNNKKYLTVTASQPAKEGDKKFAKRSVIVFSSVADEFVSALKEANTVINGEGEFNKMLKSGKINYFVDVKEAKNGAKYISISEHRIDVDSKKSRSTIRVFGESIESFKLAIDEAATSAKQ